MELLITDTVGIQGYVFGSNRLRENVGGSYLVAQAAGEWALEAMHAAAGGRCNIGKDYRLDPDWHIDANGDGAELVYSGGGNVLALFHDGCGDKFLRILSERLIAEAPGLELVAARIPFEFAHHELRDKLDELFQKLAREKRARPRYLALAGLGVTKPCQSTGLPAVGTFEPPTSDDPPVTRAASPDILAKLGVTNPRTNNRSPAEQRLYDLVGDSCPQEYRFPREIEDLGGIKGESSYIAVVHADGDGMSEKLRQAVAEPGLRGQNRGQIKALRDFSEAVEQAGAKALRAMVEKLVASIEPDGNGDLHIAHPDVDKKDIHIPLSVAERLPQQPLAWYLPFRPLVFGGDDISFVCDGRIGLPLAQEFLQLFGAHSKALPSGGGTACAGVAIVKSGRPFARAYAMAEELCRSAKQYRHETQRPTSCLDWHFTATTASRGIEAMRERDYQVRNNRKLHLRPVELSEQPFRPGRTWQTVEGGLREFQAPGWRDRRNKIKALREALRQGDTDVIQWFRSKYLKNGSLPTLPHGLPNWPKEGWDGDLCGYFDAIELMDHYIPLGGGKHEAAHHIGE